MADIAILDLGKTWTKFACVSPLGIVQDVERIPTPYTADFEGIPALDIDLVISRFLQTLAVWSQTRPVDAVVPVAHGASAVYLDERGEVCIPVLDYEVEPPEEISLAYDAARPPFSESASPCLPMGLNLGRQIFWMQQSYPRHFKHVQHILPLAQYLSFALSGVAACEVSSLGCHTDLWAPEEKRYSSLAVGQAWSEKFPPLETAWAKLGSIDPILSQKYGLIREISVHCGIHDTNAALFSFIDAPLSTEQSTFSLLSTGTWFVAMAPGAKTHNLEPSRDTLANVDVFSRPVACARFMGGREGEVLLDGASYGKADLRAVAKLLEQQIFALPSFTEAGGPFPGMTAEITNETRLASSDRSTLAALYLGLMADTCLNLAGARGDLFIEGPASKNRAFCEVLASLRDQPVFTCLENSLVTLGAAKLAMGPFPSMPAPKVKAVKPATDAAIIRYLEAWKEQIALRTRAPQEASL